jgi:hypothetical protein
MLTRQAARLRLNGQEVWFSERLVKKEKLIRDWFAPREMDSGIRILKIRMITHTSREASALINQITPNRGRQKYKAIKIRATRINMMSGSKVDMR